MVGKGSVNHNSREFNAKNTDPQRTHLNTEYCNIDIKEVYHYLFDDALETYNEKQKRADRRIENYYDKIDLSNKTTVTDALLSCYTAAIGDPYTIYRPPVETDAFNTNMSGKFGGIGVLAEYNHNDESIIISKVFPDYIHNQITWDSLLLTVIV